MARTLNDRIGGLNSVDPKKVPLPNGTEIKTRVRKTIPGSTRFVPQGAVGRVTSTQKNEITVRIIGVGTLVYDRSEVLPRKSGQIEFAKRRAFAEKELRPCVILESTVGSRAWGLAHEDSDVDLRGVFLFPFPWTTGLVEPPDVLVSSDGSDTYWEIEKAIGQAIKADPNTLEMLFVPEIKVFNEIGQLLIDHREAFVSTKIYGSLGRYALSQAKKLEGSLRLAEHRNFVLDWLAKSDGMTLDNLSKKLAHEALNTKDDGGIQRAKQYIKQLYRSMNDQGLLESASFDALSDFARNKQMQFELPRELRPKNAYNLLRIVSCAVHWLKEGHPLIEVHGELRDKLLAIKKGEVPLKQSLAWTEDVASQLDEARANSPLPRHPDVSKIDELLRHARNWSAQKWFEQGAGPWGQEATQPPLARIKEEKDHG